MNKYIDPDEIRRAINILKSDRQLFEIRIIRGLSSISGYFIEAEKVIEQLSKQDLKDANVYMTIQQIHDGCKARKQWNSFVDAGRAKIPTTSDNDIVRYSFIPIDLDPVRPAGISSTDEEIKAADELRKQIVSYMRAQGCKQYIQAFSGNGYHLLYPFDELNTEAAREHVKEVLGLLDKEFSNSQCKVDTSNYNPARVLKLYGTLAQKGRDTVDRPHRMSKITEVKELETS